MGLIQLPVQGVPGIPSQEVKQAGGVKLTVLVPYLHSLHKASLPSNFLSIGRLACPPVVDGGDNFEIWRIALNILNKNLRSSEQGWSSGLWAGQNKD